MQVGLKLMAFIRTLLSGQHCQPWTMAASLLSTMGIVGRLLRQTPRNTAMVYEPPSPNDVPVGPAAKQADSQWADLKCSLQNLFVLSLSNVLSSQQIPTHRKSRSVAGAPLATI